MLLGRLATVQYSGTNGGFSQPADAYADMYSYTAAGLVAAKGMQITRQVPYKDYQGVIQYTNNSFLVERGVCLRRGGAGDVDELSGQLFSAELHRAAADGGGDDETMPSTRWGGRIRWRRRGGETLVTPGLLWAVGRAGERDGVRDCQLVDVQLDAAGDADGAGRDSDDVWVLGDAE